jgi:hypothetical protein
LEAVALILTIDQSLSSLYIVLCIAAVCVQQSNDDCCNVFDEKYAALAGVCHHMLCTLTVVFIQTVLLPCAICLL